MWNFLRKVAHLSHWLSTVVSSVGCIHPLFASIRARRAARFAWTLHVRPSSLWYALYSVLVSPIAHPNTTNSAYRYELGEYTQLGEHTQSVIVIVIWMHNSLSLTLAAVGYFQLRLEQLPAWA